MIVFVIPLVQKRSLGVRFSNGDRIDNAGGEEEDSSER
jgi:hypothetical protein